MLLTFWLLVPLSFLFRFLGEEIAGYPQLLCDIVPWRKQTFAASMLTNMRAVVGRGAAYSGIRVWCFVKGGGGRLTYAASHSLRM